jgi:small subunit ribosomal protein S20
MANIKSQKKRIKQDKLRNSRNKSLKSELKTALKNVALDGSEENKVQALKSLDVAFSKGIIKKSYRDRNKSKISSL